MKAKLHFPLAWPQFKFPPFHNENQIESRYVALGNPNLQLTLLWHGKPNENRADAGRETVVTMLCLLVRVLWELSKGRHRPPVIAIAVVITTL